MARKITVTHESGGYREGEPRSGVTKSDPPRYRKYTLEQLQERGDALPLLVSGFGDVSRELWAPRGRQMALIRELGARFDDPEPTIVTRRTVLGRARQWKQEAYYGGIRKVLELVNSGLVKRWDHLEVEAGIEGGRLVVRDTAGNVVAQASRADTRALETEAAEVELEDAADVAELADVADDLVDTLEESELLEALERGELF